MAVTMQEVSEALAELGKLRFGEMRVEDAMHDIVRSTHAIFDVDGAGLMLADTDHQLRKRRGFRRAVRRPGGSPGRARRGPVHRGLHRQGAGRCRGPDHRHPVAAVQPGRGRARVRAVLASPLPYNQDAVGVVAVLSEDRHPWSPEGELALLAFTDLAALLIASMMQGQQQSELAAQLQGALDSRAVIEPAKGVLIGQQGLSPRQAYEKLRDTARAGRRKLAEVCAEVVRDAARQ
ncbi:MAG: ANTAR domain-containing protein [Streptosporangiales bacterium]